MTDVSIQDLQKLLTHFAKSTYRARDADSVSQAVMRRCLSLTDLDYTHSVISNITGDLSAHYPSHLIILENEKYRNPNMCDTPPPLPHAARTTETIYESTSDTNKLKELIKSARFARCRSRFPLPVLLYKGRHICRSATLSGGPEIYGRSGLNFIFAGNEPPVDEARGTDSTRTDWQLFDKVRQQDIKLLKTLNVGTIIDFMVEKKKVKFGMNVTSSEKVDKEKRYSEFTIVSLPYPGCEFFKEFRENNYLARGLLFDWSQNHVDAEIGVPGDVISSQLRINWEQYQLWDLVKLTKNYLKLILRYLSESSSGLLIHCISGWDRTPLFISLLRMSLWADGVIHQSLNAYQMLYYTIAYDWMLFGHDLEDRLSKGEEIFFFCFHFLKYIYDEEFSVHHRHGAGVSTSATGRSRHSDSQLDNTMFDNEGVTLRSVSSNLSLNSWCSNISQNSKDSQDNNPPSLFHVADGQDDYHSNGNVMAWTFYPSPNKENVAINSHSPPLPPNRTSPVAVPITGRLRQRNESSSSGGSWQMISGTGSLRGSTTANAPVTDNLLSSLGCKPLCETCTDHASQDSSITLIEDEDCWTLTQSRKDRLYCLRRVFHLAYSHSVGFKMKNNSESGGLGQIIGNFAERVGII